MSDAQSVSYLFCFHLEDTCSKEEVPGRSLWDTTSPRLKLCCSISSPEPTPSTNQPLQKAQDLSLEKVWRKISVAALALRTSHFLILQHFLLHPGIFTWKMSICVLSSQTLVQFPSSKMADNCYILIRSGLKSLLQYIIHCFLQHRTTLIADTKRDWIFLQHEGALLSQIMHMCPKLLTELLLQWGRKNSNTMASACLCFCKGRMDKPNFKIWV